MILPIVRSLCSSCCWEVIPCRAQTLECRLGFRIPFDRDLTLRKNVLMMSHIELKWVATSRKINLNRSRSQTKTDLYVELDIHNESKQHSERSCTNRQKRSVLWLNKNTNQDFITSVNGSTVGSPSDSLSRWRKTSDYLKINDSQCSGK